MSYVVSISPKKHEHESLRALKFGWWSLFRNEGWRSLGGLDDVCSLAFGIVVCVCACVNFFLCLSLKWRDGMYLQSCRGNSFIFIFISLYGKKWIDTVIVALYHTSSCRAEERGLMIFFRRRTCFLTLMFFLFCSNGNLGAHCLGSVPVSGRCYCEISGRDTVGLLLGLCRRYLYI